MMIQLLEQCKQTERQLGEGDITTQKAVQRLLRMVSALCRPARVFFNVEPGASPPVKQHANDAAWDLSSRQVYEVAPGSTVCIGTGVRIALPDGFEAQIRSRSGLAGRGIAVMNSPGTVDAGYRGEIGVLLHNHGNDVFRVEKGARIAQLLIKTVPEVEMEQVDAGQWKRYDSTARGSGGFGSTGM